MDPVDPTEPTDDTVEGQDEGIISDLTNTGDIVINLDNDISLEDLLSFFENPQRRRRLSVEPAYLTETKLFSNRKARLL